MPDDDQFDFNIGPPTLPPSPQQLAAYQYYSGLDPNTPTRAGVPIGLLGTMINRYESGNNYDRLASTPVAQSNATSLPTLPGGFPDWPGARNVYGATSHGAGVAQMEPSLWGEASQALGLADFSPSSQDAARNWAVMRYGTAPWKTNQQLSQAINYYKQYGQIPPATMNFPTYYGGRLAAR